MDLFSKIDNGLTIFLRRSMEDVRLVLNTPKHSQHKHLVEKFSKIEATGFLDKLFTRFRKKP